MPPAPLIPSPEATRAANVTAAPYNGGAAPTSTSGQAVLASSTPARTATADNVTKLQTITAPVPSSLQPAVDSINKAVDQYNNPVKSVTQTPEGGTKTTLDTSNPTPTGTGGASADPNKTTTTSSQTGDQYDAAVKGISDPGIAAQYKSYLQTQDQEISEAQSNIDIIKQRSLNDPAMLGIVNSIKAKYEQQIGVVRAKNGQLMGQANNSVAAFGGLGMMGQSFLSDQQSKADARVQELQNQEDAAIAKAQAAYITNNYKDLNEAMSAYDKANAGKLKALNDLLTASGKQVTQMQAEQRLELQERKAKLTSDVTQSTKMATAVAANIKEAGLTDPAQIKQYIEGLAAQYDISNPDILYSQVVGAQQKATKDDLAAANTKDLIANRDAATALKAKKAAAPKAAPKPKNVPLNERVDKAWATLDQLAQPGVKDKKSGVPYLIKAANGNFYFTAQGFKTLIAAARADHITRAQFIEQHADKLQPGMADNYGITPKEAEKIGL